VEIYYDEVKESIIFQGLINHFLIKIAQRIEIPINQIVDVGLGFELKKDYIKKEFYYENKTRKVAIFSNFGIRDLYYLEDDKNTETIWFKLKNSMFRYVVLKINKEKLFLLLNKLKFVFAEKRDEKLEKKIREMLNLIEKTISKERKIKKEDFNNFVG
jgi:hypothetical protein